MKRPQCFCRARRLGIRLQAALKESGLHCSTHQSHGPKLAPPNEVDVSPISENDRKRGSLAAAPEVPACRAYFRRTRHCKDGK
ncbi:hypothetical protein BJX63DRAFT_416721 [Aspergillus granulosus]|uniref:Uncharacterized protein n=1 Tax=Aspergillus granulosus TaxID=176169 RepID=A0ABR4GRL6_9EURO